MARVHLTDLEGANTMYVTTRWYRAPEVLLVGNYSYSSMQPTFPCRPGLAAAPPSFVGSHRTWVSHSRHVEYRVYLWRAADWRTPLSRRQLYVTA
jgi:hypothetical protein